MTDSRRDPRITATGDLLATLGPAGRSTLLAAQVLNLSVGGMLVAGRGYEVGQPLAVELVGPGFRLAGRGQVAHCTDSTVGVHMVSWDGPAHRLIGAIVASRARVARDLALREAPRPPACRARVDPQMIVRGRFVACMPTTSSAISPM